MSFIKMRNGYTTKKRELHFRALTTDLIVHGQVKVTQYDAKKLKQYADKMVTLAKKGTLATRRRAAAWLNRVETKKGQNSLQKLFDEIGPKYQDRNGGYTQIFKLGNRRGDDAPICLVRWV